MKSSTLEKLDTLFNILKNYNFFDQGHGYYYGPLDVVQDTFILYQDIYYTLELDKESKTGMNTLEKMTETIIEKFSQEEILKYLEECFSICVCDSTQVCYHCLGDVDYRDSKTYRHNYMPKVDGLIQQVHNVSGSRLSYMYYTDDPFFKRVGAPYEYQLIPSDLLEVVSRCA